MKVNELRVSNFVLIDRELIGIVSEIRSNHAKVIYEGGVNENISSRLSLIEFIRLYPIPLTEEWLEKFGFEKRDLTNYNRWVYDDFEIEDQGKYFAKVIWSESCPHTTHFIGHHQYIHQLQNLYFVLTGEELTIKS